MKQTIKELEKKIQNLQNQKYKLQEKERIEKIVPSLMEYKGRCFVYKNNSYGRKSKKWNVYRKVLDVLLDEEQNVYFLFEEKEICKEDGDIVQKRWSDWIFPYIDQYPAGSGYQEISPEKYDKMSEAFNIELRDMSIARKIVEKLKH